MMRLRIIVTLVFSGVLCACAPKVVTNDTAPPSNQPPNLIDTELKDLSRQLIDEHRKLANIRQTKQDSVFSKQQDTSRKARQKFSGLETNRNVRCQCDIKTAMQAIAVNLNWDINKVLEIGHKPANGVPVQLRLDDQPLSLALEQIDIQTGHFIDIRIDPNFETILITYRTLDKPREPHQ